MRPISGIEWRFDGDEDAAAYRNEVARLWATWLAGLLVLMLGRGWVVPVAGITVLVLLLVLARPLQARAEAIVPKDSVPDPGKAALLQRSTRDRVLRELAFGEAPLLASGCGRGWIWARRVVIGVTFAALAIVLYDLLLAPR